MNKLNQKGFTGFEIALLLLVVALIGFAGYTVWHNNKTETNSQVTVLEDDDKEKEVISEPKFDPTIIDVQLTLNAESDLAKLPASTPKSFIEFIRADLKVNDSLSKGCISSHKIEKISQVNIKGAVIAEARGIPQDECLSAAPALWALSKSNVWKKLSLNGPSCTGEDEAKTYIEFVPKCYVNENSQELSVNPNGSIKLLVK